MKLLRKRWFAAVLMALLVVLALFLGAIRSAYAARGDAKDAFFEPEDGYGNLNESFLTLTDSAKSLYSLGKKYGVESAEEYKAALDTAKKAAMPAEKSLDSLDEGSAKRALSRLGIELQRIEQIARIRKSSFNAAVEEYNTGVLDSPLTGWLLRLLGFEEMEKIY